MKKILRSVCWLDLTEKDLATENLRSIATDRMTNTRKAERDVLEFITDFYARQAEAPKLHSIHSHFEGLNDPDAVTLIEEFTAETFYASGSFLDLYEGEIEEQAAQNLTQVLKEAAKIATVGLEIGKTKTIIKGSDEAVAYLFSNARGKPPRETSGLSANMRANEAALTELYEGRKNNPTASYGIPTGYGLIDSSTAGIRRKQLLLLAGFGGHLKSTLMMNIMLNAAVIGGWNQLLFTSEMPAEEVQQLLIAMHSADPKFAGIGLPIQSFRLLLGALKAPEEAFYQEVKHDLLTNPNYGSIRVIDSGEFTSFGSIQQRTLREHATEEVDQLWVDYITRLPLDAKYARMDYTTAMNETIKDAKRFAMSFEKGKGLAVCSPFQVNREGYKKARENSGKMDKTHLAQFNSAEREADVIAYIYFDEEEQATNEPKVGMMKSRYGSAAGDPVPMFIEPDSRRIMDLTGGLGVSRSYGPTGGGTPVEEDVDL